MRKIPATMATQHPDNASSPYWEKDGDGFVSTREEARELFSAFHDLECQEFMWDWEGKYVDEAVVDRLFHNYYDYFKKHQLGKDRFLTFRIPNIWREKGYGLARAMMGILTAENFAHDLNFHCPPLFEVILPMTEKAENILYIQKTFTRLSNFKAKLFSEKHRFNYLHVLPLLEGVGDFFQSKKTLERYVSLHRREYKRKPEYMRFHIARSDPALNGGLVSAVVGGKIALSEAHVFGKEKKIQIFPAIGVGTLPFRGGLSPERISDFLSEYAGVSTAYIQSAFRYDFPLPMVKKGIGRLNSELQKTECIEYNAKQIRTAEEICQIFTALYRKTVEPIASFVNELAKHVPTRRERKLHIGLFGYSRNIGKKKLPRAIPFTSVFYSLGVPPEFIGTGRGLRECLKRKIDVEIFYKNFKKDILLAGRFLNKENLSKLARQFRSFRDIENDVSLLEEILGIEFGPKKDMDFIHRNHTSNFYFLWNKKQPLATEIIESGKIRKSLG